MGVCPSNGPCEQAKEITTISLEDLATEQYEHALARASVRGIYLEEASQAEEEESSSSSCLPKIRVHIAGCRGAREWSWLPKTTPSDMYVSVGLDSSVEPLHRTKLVRDQVWPMWREECEVAWVPGQSLEFELMEVLYDTYGLTGRVQLEAHSSLGSGTLLSSDFQDGGYNGALVLDSRTGPETLLRVRVALPGQDYPADPPMKFSMSFDRAECAGPLGLAIDQSDGRTLCVRAVEQAGTVVEYNRGAEPGLRVRPRDFITRVNDVEGSAAALLREIEAPMINLVVQRPMELAVAIPSKERNVHGLEFANALSMEWLLVTNVRPGTSAAAHNEAAPELQVLPADRVVRAFAAAGHGSDIVRTASCSSGLQCQLFRPFDGSSASGAWYSLPRGS